MSEKLYYYYSSALGMVQNTAAEFKKKLNAIKSKGTESKNVQYYETESLALIAYYKGRSVTIDESISRYQRHINESKNMKYKLDAEFEYLKDEHPEEFV